MDGDKLTPRKIAKCLEDTELSENPDQDNGVVGSENAEQDNSVVVSENPEQENNIVGSTIPGQVECVMDNTTPKKTTTEHKGDSKLTPRKISTLLAGGGSDDESFQSDVDELDLSAESEIFDSDKDPDFVLSSNEDSDIYKPTRLFELRFQRQMDPEQEAGPSRPPWSDEPTPTSEIEDDEQETEIHKSPKRTEERGKKRKRKVKLKQAKPKKKNKRICYC